MPSFATLAPIVGGVLGAASGNSNRSRQFQLGNLQNAFSVFTGQPRQDLSALTQNNSLGTVLKGVTAGLQNADREKQQKAADDLAKSQVQFKIDNADKNRDLLQNIFGGSGGVAANLGSQGGFSALQGLFG